MDNSLKTLIEKINAKSNEYLDSALTGTRNHYSLFLPENSGRFVTSFLKFIFSGIKINEDRAGVIQKLKNQGIIVYATKYKNYLEYLFYHTRYPIEQLPCPEISFEYKPYLFQPIIRVFRIVLANIDYVAKHMSFPSPYKSGYIIHELITGKSGIITLVDKKSFYLRFVKEKIDPIHYLVNIQATIDRPIFIVPQLICFSRDPHRSGMTITDILFGTKENPGTLRQVFTLIKSPKKIFVELAEPVNLKEFLDIPEIRKMDSAQKSTVLRRHLLSLINRRRQSITGPVIKSREEIKQSILTNRQLQQFMDNYSKQNNIPVHQVHKEADSYLNEIAANLSHTWIKVYDIVLTWILKNIFEDLIVDREALSKIREMSQKGPLILVPCHKSHLDYLILSYVFYYNNMPCPHVAAGKNLSFWPLGVIFRGGGAFFIRRTFKGAVLYSQVFSFYIKKLLEEGFNIEFFIEGGRSRTGKVLMPKFGLLSILLNAYKDGACDDMVFVPINIGYDRVLEEKAYRHEIEGGRKNDESLMQVIKAGKFLKRRYGKVYVNYHEPVSLKEYLEKNDITLSKTTSKDELSKTCRDLAYRFIYSINEAAVVTPFGLVASAILNCSRNKFSYAHLISHLETYMAHLTALKVNMSDTLMMDRTRAFNHVLYTFTQRQFIECVSEAIHGYTANTQFVINEDKRPDMEYYKNNCIAFFIPAAFTALSILGQDAFLFSAARLNPVYSFLKDFFKNEFVHDADRLPDYFIRKSLKSFVEDAMIIPHSSMPDTFNLTSAGYKKLKFFASFLKTFFESYYVVLTFYMQHPEDIEKGGNLKRIQSMGSRMYKKNEIERIESLSRITFKNADSFFAEQGMPYTKDSPKMKFYADEIQKHLNYLTY